MTIDSRRQWSPYPAGRRQTKAIITGAIAWTMLVLAASCIPVGTARAQAATPRYPHAAPIEQYRSKTPAEEIALARTAAPPSISSNAEVMVLSDGGYQTAVRGTNGFVCLVERSWNAGFDDPYLLEHDHAERNVQRCESCNETER